MLKVKGRSMSSDGGWIKFSESRRDTSLEPSSRVPQPFGGLGPDEVEFTVRNQISVCSYHC
jgi:hypothetical protein